MNGLEIERKFLVDLVKFNDEKDNLNIVWSQIKQGYIQAEDGGFIRIRLKPEENKAYLTIKENVDKNTTTRIEVEKELPYITGCKLYDICDYDLSKNRGKFYYEGNEWVVDIFDDIDLTMAEIELESEDEVFASPLWMIKDVTSDLKYRNENLVRYGL